ncbi:MAG: carboxy terminal-processing peptidase [Salibacteraceae bacterium]
MIRIGKYIAFFLAVILFSSWIYSESVSHADPAPAVQPPQKNEVLMEVIMESLKRRHYNPLNINDDYSSKAYQLYLKRLDYNKRYFTKSEIAQLSAFEFKIDDQISDKAYEFFNLSDKIFTKRIETVKGFYEELLAQPFDYNKEESIETEPDKLIYADSDAALKDRWRKVLKFAVIFRVYDEMKKTEKKKKKGEEVTEKSFQELEEDARGKVLKNYNRWYKRMQQMDENDRLTLYINSIVNIHGPHTSWFPPKNKEDFDISISGKLEGIGAQLVERDGFIKVSSIVPGSASARQGELKAGDLILKVAQGEEEPVDVVEMRLDEAVKLIRGRKGTEVRLTVEKVDGTIKVIPIIRDIVVIEATYAKSALLKNEENTKKPVGYIYLPKFYADFSRRGGGRHASSDVKKEIIKLKAEGVSGIILDLRDNGGGSLQDAIDMAGLFIEQGPIVQVRDKNQASPTVYRDRDPKLVYDGPLVVMLNSNSASASEILAAAIQDYDRGVIVGSTSSFGKGTVQRFFGLDDVLPDELNNIKPLGAVKITMQKFYRINGGSTQLKGVTPDIIFPDRYQYIETGEKEQEYVMPWDKIEPVEYKAWSPKYKVDQLKENSEKRIAQNEGFNTIEEYSKRLETQQNESLIPLNWLGYRNMRMAREEESQSLKDLDKQMIETLEVNNLPEDLIYIEADTSRTKLNESWLKELNRDLYVNEAMYILSDMR